jgi:ribosome-associated protein
MPAESIRVTRSVNLPLGEIELRFSRSSGPGGQHAQRTESRVEAVLDLETTTALTEAQRKRAIGRVGPVVRAIAQDERSQWRNRELAVERLVEALRAALKVERKRRATRPTLAAKEKRLEQKRRQGEKKRLRRPPP